MLELPALRVLSVVQDLAAIERTMSQVFGITKVRRASEAGYEALAFGFNNGEVLVVAPRREGNRPVICCRRSQ